MQFDLKEGLWKPLESLCLLESTAAVLCHEVLKSHLDLTAEEREGLKRIKEDEVRHYVLARRALNGLRKVDQTDLGKKLKEYHEDHLKRWQGPAGMIARLHEDEALVMRYMHLFDMTITGIIPEEGHAFVQAVRTDEPRHYEWGKNVIRRLTDNNEAMRRFIREQKRLDGWPALTIAREFRDLRLKLGVKV